MAPEKIILAFDVYGTLLSTESIAKKLATHFGEEKGASIAAKWRLYQLEYTWRANSMNRYEPFSSITKKSLGHALKEQGLTLSSADTDELMRAYDSLSTFSDVQPALEVLGNAQDVTCVFFSQGTYEMVSTSVTRSPDLGPHAISTFKDIIVVEETKKFKPAPETYHHLIKRLGKTAGDFNGVWLVSSNPFDIVGSRAVGMEAAWVDRAGNGWIDNLGDAPSIIVNDIREVVDKVKAFKR